MSSTTVAEFASELKKSTHALLEQLRSAGVAKSGASDSLSEADKQKLLGYLHASHGTATGWRKNITPVKRHLTRKHSVAVPNEATPFKDKISHQQLFPGNNAMAPANSDDGNRFNTCPTCSGTGGLSSSSGCPRCGGNGYL